MSLFWWVINVGRRTNILHRLRLQRRSEAGTRRPHLRPIVERTLEVGHRESRRQSPGLYWSSAAPNRGHGDSFSKTSWFLGGLVVR